MELAIVARFLSAFENVLLKLFPPLNRLKVMFAGLLDRENATQSWKAVVLQDSEKYRFAFLVQETEIMGVFFVMKGESIRDGMIEMLKKGAYTYTEVDAIKMKASMRQFGYNATALLGATAKTD